jgi:hypothetical protein
MATSRHIEYAIGHSIDQSTKWHAVPLDFMSQRGGMNKKIVRRIMRHLYRNPSEYYKQLHSSSHTFVWLRNPRTDATRRYRCAAEASVVYYYPPEAEQSDIEYWKRHLGNKNDALARRRLREDHGIEL